ncbi:P-loop containing nucleoside triphosphate hydrolase protein [Blyttiomyces helicus]|uniref:P-loop containing nucleoside triphosphate hydrolase protein n=1 Tax=Blyttiomyces helicus TaxID=388810 RepID=A0A4P9WKJ8_9FUNG|nr:P-loop containing nucleoside triphosphate hydrolase protein [Blyttiomyces helicus]|eukprot:RKO91690.1 P-loop containing nucleoside triphosphate hydrolase protein [Blyttiomyces helicus]
MAPKNAPTSRAREPSLPAKLPRGGRKRSARTAATAALLAAPRPGVPAHSVATTRARELDLKYRKKFALAEVAYDTLEEKSLSELKQFVKDSRFEDMQLRPEILEGLLKIEGVKQPTEVQAVTMPSLLASPYGTFLCASETGTGKTLTFLVPVMNQLREEEALHAQRAADRIAESGRRRAQALIGSIGADGSVQAAMDAAARGEYETLRKRRCPRAIVLAPSRELVAQIASVAKELAHSAKLRVLSVSHNLKRAELLQALDSGPVDLLITTPHTLHRLIAEFRVSLSHVRQIVVDEVDVLLDASFNAKLKEIILIARDHAGQLGRPCGFTFVSATLSRTAVREIDSLFPVELRRITTPGLHRTLPRVHQTFLRIDGSTTKPNMLLETLKRAVQTDERIIVFCNRVASAQTVAQLLRDKGYDVLELTSEVESRDRIASLERFSVRPVRRDAEGVPIDGSDPLPPLVIVATDLVARGLDLGVVAHVVMYDFPMTTIDYLHRAGRTARNGRRGKVTCLVGNKDRKMADLVQHGIRRNAVLAV